MTDRQTDTPVIAKTRSSIAGYAGILSPSPFRSHTASRSLSLSQLLIDGTPIVAIVVGAKSISDGEVEWSTELEMTSSRDGEFRPGR